MTYRELLNMCKTQPGCLATKEQQEKDAYVRYRTWVETQDKKNTKEKKEKNT